MALRRTGARRESSPSFLAKGGKIKSRREANRAKLLEPWEGGSRLAYKQARAERRDIAQER